MNVLLDMGADMCVWIRETGSGPPTHVRANSEPSPTEGPGEPGSWRPTHRRVWLTGTRAEPDSRARLARVWGP
jgi:hypothetical protein